MITRDRHTFADGSVKTQIRVRQTYRPYPGAGAKRRTVKDFGYLEDQEDPDAFWSEVTACNESLRTERAERLTVNTTQLLRPETRLTRDYGIWFGYAVCRQLNTGSLFGEGVSDEVFRYLVSDRMIFKDPLGEAVKRIPICYGADGLASENLFHSLGQYGDRYTSAMMGLDKSVYGLTGMSLVDLVAQPPDWIREPDGRRTAKTALSLALLLNEELQPVCITPICEGESISSVAAEVRKDFRMSRCVLITGVSSESSEEIEQFISQGNGFLFFRGTSPVARLTPDCGETCSEWKLEVDADTTGSYSSPIARLLYIEMDEKGPSTAQMIGMTSEVNTPAEQLKQVLQLYQSTEASLREVCYSYDSRVPYVNTLERVRGLFLVCVTALVAVRLIQRSMKEEKIPARQIADVLRECRCMVSDWNGCIVMMEILSSPEKWQNFIRIQRAFGSEYFYFISRKEDFGCFLEGLKLHL